MTGGDEMRSFFSFFLQGCYSRERSDRAKKNGHFISLNAALLGPPEP